MTYYVYMLRCEGGSLYAGITTDVPRRMAEHLAGGRAGARYTRAHKPVALEAVWSAPDRVAASTLEYRIKRLSKPAKERLLAQPGEADAVAFPLFEGEVPSADGSGSDGGGSEAAVAGASTPVGAPAATPAAAVATFAAPPKAGTAQVFAPVPPTERDEWWRQAQEVAGGRPA